MNKKIKKYNHLLMKTIIHITYFSLYLLSSDLSLNSNITLPSHYIISITVTYSMTKPTTAGSQQCDFPSFLNSYIVPTNYYTHISTGYAV